MTEDDNSEDDSDSRESAYRCSHCFTTSKKRISLYLTQQVTFFVSDSRDWQPAPGGNSKERSTAILCSECRAHLKKTGELPPLTAPAAAGSTANGKGEYLFRPVSESPDASPQRMRTRNKAAKEQTARSRPKRGGTETPDDDKAKTPSKNAPTSNASSPDVKGSSAAGGGATPATPTTPQAKKKASKADTPTKGKKRQQDTKEEITEGEEKELGLFKKKRDRPEVSFC